MRHFVRFMNELRSGYIFDRYMYGNKVLAVVAEVGPQGIDPVPETFLNRFEVFQLAQWFLRLFVRFFWANVTDDMRCCLHQNYQIVGL